MDNLFPEQKVIYDKRLSTIANEIQKTTKAGLSDLGTCYNTAKVLIKKLFPEYEDINILFDVVPESTATEKSIMAKHLHYVKHRPIDADVDAVVIDLHKDLTDLRIQKFKELYDKIIPINTSRPTGIEEIITRNFLVMLEFAQKSEITTELFIKNGISGCLKEIENLSHLNEGEVDNTKRPLVAPSANSLDDCLRELKFGRHSTDQELLDKFIEMYEDEFKIDIEESSEETFEVDLDIKSTILLLIEKIEKMGADVRLSNAQTNLDEAINLISDFEDNYLIEKELDSKKTKLRELLACLHNEKLRINLTTTPDEDCEEFNIDNMIAMFDAIKDGRKIKLV